MSADVVEDAPIMDFDLPGPRPEHPSRDPEYSCVPLHSFKNGDAMSWLHSHDILMATS